MPSFNPYTYSHIDNTTAPIWTTYSPPVIKETRIFDVGKLVKIGSTLCVVIQPQEIRYCDIHAKRHLVHRLQEADRVEIL